MENSFSLHQGKGVTFFQANLFNQSHLVNHAFTTRQGGVSQPPFAQLNLAFHVGDDSQRVVQNRKLVSSALGIELADWVAGKQVHGDTIAVITREDRGRGAFEYESALPDTDGLVTNIPGIVLTSYCADCVPIAILDTKQKAVGLAHAGWRGVVKKIGAKTLQKMQSIYGSSPKDCLVAIGPSIGPSSFIVDQYVLDIWKENFPYWNELIQEEGEGKWLIDLWKTNQKQFLDLGVPSENIAISGLSTLERTDLFYSYRAEKGQTGRMAALISLKI